jgi:hypothetical protein
MLIRENINLTGTNNHILTALAVLLKELPKLKNIYLGSGFKLSKNTKYNNHPTV